MSYSVSPSTITEYWVEVKTAKGSEDTREDFRSARVRFRHSLQERFTAGAFDNKQKIVDLDVAGDLYREVRTLLTMVEPILAGNLQRLAFQGEVDRLFDRLGRPLLRCAARRTFATARGNI